MITASRMSRKHILCNVCRHHRASLSIRIRTTEQFVLCYSCSLILRRIMTKAMDEIRENSSRLTKQHAGD